MSARARRLLVPFVVFMVFYKLVLFVRVAAWPGGRREWRYAGGPQLYFLPYLFAVAVLAAVVVVVVRGRPGGLVAAVGLAAGAGVVLTTTHPPPDPYLQWAGFYLACYLAGVCVNTGGYALAAGLLAAAAAGAGWWVGNWGLISAGVPPVLYALLAALGPRVVTTPVEWLGRWSAVVFVWHAPLVMPVCAVLATRLFGHGPAGLAAMLAGTVIGSVALGRVVNRWNLLRPFRV